MDNNQAEPIMNKAGISDTLTNTSITNTSITDTISKSISIEKKQDTLADAEKTRVTPKRKALKRADLKREAKHSDQKRKYDIPKNNDKKFRYEQNIKVKKTRNKELTLNLNNGDIKEKKLPKDIDESIENLALQSNELLYLPDELFKYKKLKYLDISYNKITEIPTELRELQSLEYLDLSNNKLSDINKVIGDLARLKVLKLSGNKLRVLPKSICKLHGLKILDIRKNDLSSRDLLTIARCLPNTNILYDKYIQEQQ